MVIINDILSFSTMKTHFCYSQRWWKSVGGLFSVDGGGSPAPSSPPRPTSDLEKLQSLLETTEANLITMFGVSLMFSLCCLLVYTSVRAIYNHFSTLSEVWCCLESL